MPTEAEIRVLELLNAIDLPDETATWLQKSGNEYVTVVCEAALGSYPGLRKKARFNAVALAGRMDHPQTRETIDMLINDPTPDVAIRAMRAIGRHRNVGAVQKLSDILNKPQSSDLIAAEALKALIAIDSPESSLAIEHYRDAQPSSASHRRASVVGEILSGYRR